MPKKTSGPCPPIGRHRYFFKLYALEATLSLDSPTKVALERGVSMMARSMPGRIHAGQRPLAARPERSAPPRFRHAGSTRVCTEDASDVVALPGGKFLIVGDSTDALEVLGKGGDSRRVKLPGIQGRSGLEAVAYDPHSEHLFVVREERGELLRYEFPRDGSGAPTLEKRLSADLGGGSNKGVEGLAYLPAQLSPTGRPQLVLANEGKPKRLALLEDGGKGPPREVALDARVKELCEDFSALAVDPRTGDLFLASQESALVAQLRLRREGDRVTASLVQSIPLRDGRGAPLPRVEGIAFDERGDLFALTEDEGRLHRLARS